MRLDYTRQWVQADGIVSLDIPKKVGAGIKKLAPVRLTEPRRALQ
jgi:hypothetical protein